ncbi:hypothetical protein GQ600_24940 [Phytophthora cactorum]|nr:hypothetical protein GQ600_24940 [Phytophthora cactorum]
MCSTRGSPFALGDRSPRCSLVVHIVKARAQESKGLNQVPFRILHRTRDHHSRLHHVTRTATPALLHTPSASLLAAGDRQLHGAMSTQPRKARGVLGRGSAGHRVVQALVQNSRHVRSEINPYMKRQLLFYSNPPVLSQHEGAVVEMVHWGRDEHVLQCTGRAREQRAGRRRGAPLRQP